jgi:hypothetical protein
MSEEPDPAAGSDPDASPEPTATSETTWAFPSLDQIQVPTVSLAGLEPMAADLNSFFESHEKELDAGIPLGIETHLATHPVQDAELNAANSVFLSLIRLLTAVLNNLTAWQTSAPQVIKHLRSSSGVYLRVVPSSDVSNWAAALQAAQQQADPLATERIASYVTDTLVPLYYELLGLEPARSEATAACFAWEQSLKSRATFGSIAARVRLDVSNWGAQYEIEYARTKPQWLATINAFAQRVREILKRLAVTLQADFEQLSEAIFIGYRDQRVPEPPLPAPDYGEIDRLITEAMPKELREQREGRADGEPPEPK